MFHVTVPPHPPLSPLKNASKIAVAGELFSAEAKRRSLAGMLIEGSCRDTETIARVSVYTVVSRLIVFLFLFWWRPAPRCGDLDLEASRSLYVRRGCKPANGEASLSRHVGLFPHAVRFPRGRHRFLTHFFLFSFFSRNGKQTKRKNKSNQGERE